MRLDVSAVISRQILPARIREESPLTAAPPCAFAGSLRASVRFPLRWVARALVFPAPGPQVAALSSPPFARCWPAAAAGTVSPLHFAGAKHKVGRKSAFASGIYVLSVNPTAKMGAYVRAYRPIQGSHGVWGVSAQTHVATDNNWGLWNATGALKYLPEVSFYKLKQCECEFNGDFSVWMWN